MDAQEIINYIATAPKKTPVKLYVKLAAGAMVDWGDAHVFGDGDVVVFGNWDELGPIVSANAGAIEDIVIENDRRNSGVPLLDLKGVNARIEPGALIREKVEIGDNAVIMMGAVINIGAVISARAPCSPAWSSPPARRPSSSRTTSCSARTPWSSRASAWARGPWSRPAPSWSTTFPPAPSSRDAPPRSSR